MQSVMLAINLSSHDLYQSVGTQPQHQHLGQDQNPQVRAPSNLIRTVDLCPPPLHWLWMPVVWMEDLEVLVITDI